MFGKIKRTPEDTLLYRHNEERYTDTLNSIPFGIVVTDKKRRTTFINSVAGQIAGVQREAVLGKYLEEFLHIYDGENGNAMIDAIVEAIGKDKIVRFSEDCVLLTADERKIQIYCSIAPVESEEKKITGAVITFWDRTDIEGVEEALQRERILLRTLIDNLPDAIYVKDTECRKTVANLADVHNIGLHSEKEVLGKNDFELFPKYLAEGFYADDQAVIQTGQPALNREEFVIDENGQKRWLLTSKLPLRDEKNRIIGLVGVGHDITERKLAEEQLQQRNLELEKMVVEMRQMQRWLVQSEKLASIGQLVAGIAHEINNPLAFVSSNLNRFNEYFHELADLNEEWTKLGKVSEKNDELQDAVKRAQEHEDKADVKFLVEDFETLMRHTRDGTERIKKIVEQLRGFTRLSDNSFTEADLNTALDDTLSIAWNEIKYKATVKKEYGKIPPVTCNVGEIKQVFVNLLVNAAQAIEEKGEIVIRTGVKDSSVFVDIIDTGCGILPENLTKIFDPFFTTKPVGKGTGLGLWVSATIVQKHAGTISAESELGKGTKMTVTLPTESKV